MAHGSEDRLAPLRRAFKLERGEFGIVLWSAAFFFCVLCSYYILRSIRDSFGAGQAAELDWLFTATFLGTLVAVPIYSAVVARFPRQVFLPWVYHFMAIFLLGFFFSFRFGPEEWRPVLSRVFFVWLSVLNLFAVSALWSFMSEIFTPDRAKRVFGIIAAGGTAGAITGSLTTAVLVQGIGTNSLFLLSVVLFEAAVGCIYMIVRIARQSGNEVVARPKEVIGGGMMAGFSQTLRSPFLLAITGYVLLSTLTATILYRTQAQVIGSSYLDQDERTALFGYMDFAVNALTLFIELFFTSRILLTLGVGITLAILPALFIIGFSSLGVQATVAVVVVFQVVRRATGYSLAKPAKNLLFTLVTAEERYKSKSFIDVFVYRGGDTAGAWGFSAMTNTFGWALTAVAFATIPIAGLWLMLGLFLGRRASAKEAAA